jgi:Zinc finger, C2H2 type
MYAPQPPNSDPRVTTNTGATGSAAAVTATTTNAPVFGTGMPAVPPPRPGPIAAAATSSSTSAPAPAPAPAPVLVPVPSPVAVSGSAVGTAATATVPIIESAAAAASVPPPMSAVLGSLPNTGLPIVAATNVQGMESVAAAASTGEGRAEDVDDDDDAAEAKRQKEEEEAKQAWADTSVSAAQREFNLSPEQVELLSQHQRQMWNTMALSPSMRGTLIEFTKELQYVEQSDTKGDDVFFVPMSLKLGQKFLAILRKANAISAERRKARRKAHKCPLCTQSFTRARNLKRHQRVHTKEKPFACPLCPKHFADYSNMIRHKALHSKYNVMCRICSAGYKTTIDVEEHYASGYHTPQELALLPKSGLRHTYRKSPIDAASGTGHAVALVSSTVSATSIDAIPSSGIAAGASSSADLQQLSKKRKATDAHSSALPQPEASAKRVRTDDEH